MQDGFTLIELLICISIVSLVSVAVYSVFANGIKAWRRGNINRNFARHLRLSTEKMARDLRNSFKFSNIFFEGTEDSMMFPALILVRSISDEDKGEGELHYEIGRVAYFYNKEEEALCKEEKSYQQVYEDEKINTGTVIIPNLRKLELSYCYLDNATGAYKWKEDWKKEEQDSIPQAIQMELTFKKNSGYNEKFIRTIFLPLGTGEQKIELGSVVKGTEEK
jgi:prepilin-type N-terminal cleavage/methylation domain-containing protein